MLNSAWRPHPESSYNFGCILHSSVILSANTMFSRTANATKHRTTSSYAGVYTKFDMADTTPEVLTHFIGRLLRKSTSNFENDLQRSTVNQIRLDSVVRLRSSLSTAARDNNMRISPPCGRAVLHRIAWQRTWRHYVLSTIWEDYELIASCGCCHVYFYFIEMFLSRCCVNRRFAWMLNFGRCMWKNKQ